MGLKVKVTVTYETELDPSDHIDIEQDDDGEDIDPSNEEVIEAYLEDLKNGDIDIAEELSMSHDPEFKVVTA